MPTFVLTHMLLSDNSFGMLAVESCRKSDVRGAGDGEHRDRDDDAGPRPNQPGPLLADQRPKPAEGRVRVRAEQRDCPADDGPLRH